MKTPQNSTIFIILTLLPLVFIEEYINGMQVPRIIVFWLLTGLVVIAYFFKHILKQQFLTLKLNAITIALSLYVLSYFISSLSAKSPTLSFYSNFVRMDGFVSCIFYYVFYILLSSSTKISSKCWFTIAKVSCFVAFIVSIIASQRVEYPYFRSSGTFANPLTLAIYLLFHVFLILHYIISFASFESTKDKIALVVSLTFCLSYLAGIIFSQSRAAYLSLGVGGLIWCVHLFLTQIHLRKKLLIISSTTFLVAVSLISYFAKTNLLKRVTEFKILDNSGSTRLELWKIILDKGFDNSFWGDGKEHFIYFYSLHYNNSFSESGDWYDRSHNFLLDKFLDHGFVGFLSYLALIGVVYGALHSKETSIDTYTKGFLLAFLSCYCVFHFSSFESFPSHIIFISLLIYISQNLRSTKLRISRYIVGICSIFVLITLSWIFFKTAFAYLRWNNISHKNDSETIKEYEKLIRFAEIGKYDIVLKYDLLRNQTEINSPTYFQSAIKHTQELLLLYPNHPILLSQLGLLQMQKGDLQSAIETYLVLKKIAPNRHINLMDLGMLFVQNKEFEKALSVFEGIYRMDKHYEQALINKAYVYALQGNYVESNQTLDMISTKNLVNHFDKVTDVYRILGKQEVLLAKFENVRYDERKFFQPRTYLQCLELAVLLGKNESIRKAIFYCLGYYGIEFDKNEVENMVTKIQEKKLSPKVFYDKFKEERWGEYVVAYSEYQE